MRTLANSILDLAAFLELSDGETVDSRAALKALEWLVYSLQSANAEELEALRQAVRERLAQEKNPACIAFLKAFPENFPSPPDGVV